MSGRPFIEKDTEPYTQYWLTERDRLLHGLFAAPRGVLVDDAVAAYFRLTRASRTSAERRRLGQAIDQMRAAGVLIATRDDTSRYTTRIVSDYIRHRPFPGAIADLIVEAAPVHAQTRVIDVAGGPGDLALALAAHTPHVTMVELSRAFAQVARRRARLLQRPLVVEHDSANRLAHRDDAVDVITCSQALHWLDDVQVVKGVCRVLRPGGSFFVIQSSIEVPDDHPMAPAVGRHSVLGAKPTATFADDIEPLRRRLTLLFQAIDTPDVQGHHPGLRRAAGGSVAPIVPARVSLFRQARPFDLGYVRGFVTDAHIAPTGQTPDAFWRMLGARAAAAPAEAFMGTHHWAVLQFTRGGTAAAGTPVAALPSIEIPFPG